MRFTIASLFFIIASFIFFAAWAFCSFLLDTVQDALVDNIGLLSSTSQTAATGQFDLIVSGFGIFAALFFIVGLLLTFVADSWRDDPEYYYR